MKKEITCINCPIGCRITVDINDGEIVKISGNSCKRGVEYAKTESITPKRIVTASLLVENRDTPISVKTSNAIPKELIFDCMEALLKLKIKPPIKIGDVILKNVCLTGIDVVATRNLD